MPFKFNPFSGNFDQTGSGGGASYIDGEVATYNDLPLSSTTAPLDSAWLVRSSSGVWPFTKPGGVYIRTATGGSSRDADYTYAGVFPDVFSDSVFLLYDEASTTRTGQFNLGSITAGQNRVLTWPDGNGTIARTEDFAAPPAIGSTTRNSGAFTTLNATNGTLTASAPVLDLAQTWNNAAVAFTGMRFNVTNTASAAASLLADFQVGGTSQFSVRRDGVAQMANGAVGYGQGGIANRIGFYVLGTERFRADGSGLFTVMSNGGFSWTNSPANPLSGTSDLFLRRDAAGTVGQHDGANPQAYRLYNTFTDASNYERGFMRWSSNVLEIGTEGAGTGNTTRELRLFCGANEGIRIQSNAVLIRRQTLNINNASITNTSGAEDESGFSLNLRPFSTGNVIINSGLIKFHGTTSSFPALKRSSTTLQVRLADDSAFAPLSCGALTLNGNLDASTKDIVTDTTTGTKIGTGTTQKLGFFNATPIVRPAAIADATDAATTQARLNDLLAAMRSLGLIAT